MIHEVDEAIRKIVTDEVLAGTELTVVFDAPTKDWAAKRVAPVIDAYLYDIREEVARRSVGVRAERDQRGVVVAERQPMRYYRLAYLLTAWAQRPEDEHRLLSALLACFVRREAIAPEELPGALGEQALPVRVAVAAPPKDDRQVSEVWSAMGGELRAALDLVLTVPVEVGRLVVPAPPVEQPLTLVVQGAGGGESIQGRRRATPDESRERPADADADAAADAREPPAQRDARPAARRRRQG